MFDGHAHLDGTHLLLEGGPVSQYEHHHLVPHSYVGLGLSVPRLHKLLRIHQALGVDAAVRQLLSDVVDLPLHLLELGTDGCDDAFEFQFPHSDVVADSPQPLLALLENQKSVAKGILVLGSQYVYRGLNASDAETVLF